MGRLLFAALTLTIACTPTTQGPPPEALGPNAGAEAAVASAPDPGHVGGPEAHALVENGARLVDVRSPEEFAGGHIKGAENVPVDTIGAVDMGPKDRDIVVYCHSGRRAARAAEALRQRGYTKVHDLGAMANWDAK